MTEAIAKVIRDELASRAEELNKDLRLRNVQLLINIDSKTGTPREVIFRKESRTATHGAANTNWRLD